MDDKEARQREAATRIAREQVTNAYASSSSSTSQNTSKMKDDTNIHVTKEEWERYHTAWQDYYQKYYCDYYTNAAKNYIAKEKLRQEREAAEREQALEEAKKLQGGAETAAIDGTGTASYLKRKIQERAGDEAVRMKRRKKIAPIIAGAIVMLVFLFLQYNRMIFAPIAAYVSPGEAPTDKIEAIDPTVSGGEISPDPKIIIPKINVNVPVAFGIDASEVDNAMMYGVAHYRVPGASAFPGEIGNTVITGHSAGDIYSNLPYKYIFSGLERLSEGDLIYINYNSVRYTYKITKFEVVEPSNVQALVYTTDKPMLTLITCTPLGTSRYRLLVTAEQIAPSYEHASSSEPAIETEVVETMPANEKTFFEKIWDWLTRGEQKAHKKSPILVGDFCSRLAIIR